MKKRHILTVLSLSCLLLVGCSDIEARPDSVKNEDSLVEVQKDGKTVDIYNNEFTDLYESLVNAGTTNTNVINELIQILAKKEVGVTAEEASSENNKNGYKSFETIGFVTEEKYEELMDEYMVDLVLGGSYSEDSMFQEEKFAREQREALYTITDNDGSESEENFNDHTLLIPGITFAEIFGVNGDKVKGREKYKEYREKVVSPIIYKRLLTAKYLRDNKYKALGRAAARDVRVISIDNSSTKDSGSAMRTLSNYIGGYLYAIKNSSASDIASYFPLDENNEVKFDIDSLSRIWKGVYSDDTLTTLEENEKAFIAGKNGTHEVLYTINQETIVDELDDIAVQDENNVWQLKDGLNLEDSHITELLSKYTGSYSYPLNWGVTLAEREIQIQDIVDDDLYIQKTGLTSLPSDVRSRLFAVNVKKNIETVGETNFLMPETKVNSIVDYTTIEGCIKAAENYVHYDSSSKTYYVILVDDYGYSTDETEGLGKEYKEDASDEVKAKALEVGLLLGDDSSYQNDAVIHYFKEDNDIYRLYFHDDDFYDYMESNYAEIFEDD